MLNPSNWSIQIPGKWILAGEHAVLRGCSALVFPLHSRYLQCDYVHDESKHFELIIVGTDKTPLVELIKETFFNVLSKNKINYKDLKGTLTLTPCIQFGAGMGASATLAVGITLFLHHLKLLSHLQSKQDLFTFAKTIEDEFHGESSGVDVAIALEKTPLVFTRGKPWSFLESVQLPTLYISYSGETGVTKTCVNHVKSLFDSNAELAKATDEKMKRVVQKFIETNLNLNLEGWKELLNEGQSCFESWGLVPDKTREHIQWLKKNGALAVKLTGSGGGGYVLSLWMKAPIDSSVLEHLIPLS